jgi:hypothetical protein
MADAQTTAASRDLLRAMDFAMGSGGVDHLTVLANGRSPTRTGRGTHLGGHAW